jgi:hypothetical protein
VKTIDLLKRVNLSMSLVAEEIYLASAALSIPFLSTKFDSFALSESNQTSALELNAGCVDLWEREHQIL